MAKVKAPNPAYNGLSAGVMFHNGKAETNDPAALAYFRQAGYGVDEDPAPALALPNAPVDARDAAEPQPLGTRLRDAAVDPRASDYLPPTNAGDADPHGPLVVAPGIHAVGPKGIAPGEVEVDNPEGQETTETALAVAELVQDMAQPSKGASQKAWVQYAVAKGADADEAQDMTRAQLIAKYADAG